MVIGKNMNNLVTDVKSLELETLKILSLKHKEFKVRGVQFHPESILTPNGKKILENWLIT